MNINRNILWIPLLMLQELKSPIFEKDNFKRITKMSTNKWLYLVPIANFLALYIFKLNLIFNILESLISLSVSSRRNWSYI